MKHYFTATAALLALSAQAQISGPSRPGPGTSPGTFQTPGASSSSSQTTTPDAAAPTITTPDTAAISVAPPIVNPRTGPMPRTSLGTPDATGGTLGDSLRSRSAFPSSRDWETGAVGSSRPTEPRRITPPDVTPPLDTIRGSSTTIRGTGTAIPGSSTTLNGGSGTTATTAQPAMPSDLNTTGVNTPPRTSEQPLDKALSAKIRAELSQTPRSGAARLSPETIRDLRITSQGGKVTLEGQVNSAADKQLLEAQARRIPGVVAIENRVNVRSTAVGSPATGQTGQADSPKNSPALSSEHPELNP